MKKILCIVAHPDDEALGPGGTLIKHSAKGDNVNIYIFSDGEGAKKDVSKRNPQRVSAAKKWCAEIKAEIFKISNYPDQKLDTLPQIELVTEIEEALKVIQPDIVYIHNPTDINKDHEIVAKACLVALRPMRFLNNVPVIRAFETPSRTDQMPYINKLSFQPNLFISVKEEWDKKIKAIKNYEKEIGEFPHPRSLKSIEALAIKRGAESGLEMAEAFMIIKKVII